MPVFINENEFVWERIYTYVKSLTLYVICLSMY